MDLKLEIKIDDFNAAMQDMQRRLGNSVPKRKIIDSEVAKILTKTLAGTSAATKASINNSIKKTDWTTFPAAWNGGGGKRYKLTNRYPDALWARIQGQMALSLSRKIAAIGWARKSWYALGLLIGKAIPSKGADAARVAGHVAEENVAAARDETAGDYVLTVQNNSPLMRWTNGRQAFFSAIAGRTGFYRQNVAHGVFDDLSQVAKKYPGIEVTVPPPAD